MKRVVLFLCLLVFSIFSNTNNLLAKEIENNIKENIFNEIEEVKPDNKKTNISNSSEEDIFGDEQTFPFVAGLGKMQPIDFMVLDNVEKIFFNTNERS